MPGQRVLADGYGHQVSGNVFCAESSLQYIYQSRASPYPPYKLHKETSESPEENASVDKHEAEIARACRRVQKEAANLPSATADCSVCLAPGAQAQLTPCAHTFHPQCFLRWFRRNKTCPLCRVHVHDVGMTAIPTEENDAELEALMAELDDSPLDLGNVKPEQIQSQENMMEEELLDFLGPDFDTDMPMVELDNFQEKEMDVDMEAPAPAPAPKFEPSTATPDYWNVLNQGMQYVPPVPPQSAVNIAPKPTYTPQQVAEPTKTASCRCTGGCRNGRCACVKSGGICGVHCRCTDCKNPFLMVQQAGADMNVLFRDDCFMHNVSKTRDMVQRLQEPVVVPCCNKQVAVLQCLQGFHCHACSRRYDFSWCSSKLQDQERTPRNHCKVCKRCCDHRDVHCSDCNRCYFAGVTSTLPCPCKEGRSRPKEEVEEEAGEDADGECCIM